MGINALASLRISVVAASALLMFCPGCVRHVAADTADEVVVRTEEDPANAYAIGIGDVLEITVWKNPELAVTTPVRPDGRISVPLLGDVQASGLTPLALRRR